MNTKQANIFATFFLLTFIFSVTFVMYRIDATPRVSFIKESQTLRIESYKSYIDWWRGRVYVKEYKPDLGTPEFDTDRRKPIERGNAIVMPDTAKFGF